MKYFDHNVLVVEDSKLVNDTLSAYLKKSYNPTFDVRSTLTLKEAYKVLEEEEIDFVILDLELPDGVGEELMGYLGSSEKYIETKVIVLTGSIDKTRRDRLFHLGIIDYLSKDNPINFLANEIIKSVKQFVSHQNTHILVVDDSKFFAEHVATILRNQNYSVQTCLKSTEVYDLIKSTVFNLLITDLEMPEMDGISLLRVIRKDDAFLDLPIIGLSGTTNQDLVSRLLKSGANDFLSKPFIIENLLLKVDVTVSLHKKQRKLNELNEYLKEEVAKKVEDIRAKDTLLELENRHAQMGQMIANFTHQWKQPLQAISLATEYLEHLSVNKPDVKDMTKTIAQQVVFMSDTMDQFKHFFKPAKEMESFSVMGAFNEVLVMLKDTYGGIDISVTGDESLNIKGYPNEFYQVIINLINNSQDAFNEKHLKKRKISIDVQRDFNSVKIIFKDNAGGIPVEIIDSIFEQYISSKGDKGTGIGLYMVKSIVKKIGGLIKVANCEQGVCFSIILPRSQ